MSIRNFWLEGSIPGRKTDVKGGPRRKEDGMTFRYYQRDNGCIREVLSVYSFVDTDGSLVTKVYAGDKKVHSYRTER